MEGGPVRARFSVPEVAAHADALDEQRGSLCCGRPMCPGGTGCLHHTGGLRRDQDVRVTNARDQCTWRARAGTSTACPLRVPAEAAGPHPEQFVGAVPLPRTQPTDLRIGYPAGEVGAAGLPRIANKEEVAGTGLDLVADAAGVVGGEEVAADEWL